MSHDDRRIELHLIAPLRFTVRFTVRNYRAEEDDVRSILMDICRALDTRSEFRVSGFGQQRWPVDESCDLGIFLEQLPDALRRLQAGQTAQQCEGLLSDLRRAGYRLSPVDQVDEDAAPAAQ
ncbi:hypothetical protein [Roseateles noduli]|uniref:hypothetical protein n=1 Tax=Roseateles noduli TaxID=2052484 RepID=UPI003D659C82